MARGSNFSMLFVGNYCFVIAFSSLTVNIVCYCHLSPVTCHLSNECEHRLRENNCNKGEACALRMPQNEGCGTSLVVQFLFSLCKHADNTFIKWSQFYHYLFQFSVCMGSQQGIKASCLVSVIVMYIYIGIVTYNNADLFQLATPY